MASQCESSPRESISVWREEKLLPREIEVPPPTALEAALGQSHGSSGREEATCSRPPPSRPYHRGVVHEIESRPVPAHLSPEFESNEQRLHADSARIRALELELSDERSSVCKLEKERHELTQQVEVMQEESRRLRGERNQLKRQIEGHKSRERQLVRELENEKTMVRAMELHQSELRYERENFQKFEDRYSRDFGRLMEIIEGIAERNVVSAPQNIRADGKSTREERIVREGGRRVQDGESSGQAGSRSKQRPAKKNTTKPSGPFSRKVSLGFMTKDSWMGIRTTRPRKEASPMSGIRSPAAGQ